ncbi:uncharacterized protein LOC100211405 isoform X5 [Hydra vulgaris]|uniref:Uncharacterized protein LOC100211405 isoform X5 n=1 Tax=Hydra vulgaris TaxID=6087 RepID=A0ABM4C2N4_HYDVU
MMTADYTLKGFKMQYLGVLKSQQKSCVTFYGWVFTESILLCFKCILSDKNIRRKNHFKKNAHQKKNFFKKCNIQTGLTLNNIFKELRGLCPSYIDNEVHSTHSQVPCFSSISNCKNDLDCLIGLKCCSDGCVKKCTPVITENEISNAYKPSVYTYDNSQDCEYKNTTIKHNATFINSECRTCRCLNTTINCISKTNGCPDKNLSSLKPLIEKMFIKGKR